MEEYDVDSILDMYEESYVREPRNIAIGPRAMVGERTDEQTKFGRPIYKTPEGERVSEKSRTLFLDGNYINVPSIHGGKSFNEDELRLMIKRGNLKPTSVHKSREDAEAAAKARSASMAQGGRMNFQFGGGADAQKMGTEASRKYFKERKVDKPTPVFEGPAGGAKITDVKFASKAQEKEYIKILEDRFKFPKGSKEARKIATNADLAKKFGISLNNVERVNKALINKLNLSYPAQTYEGLEKIQRARDKARKEYIKKTSSGGVESKIKRDIKKVDATALAKDVDIAHRASLKANANLGAKYLTTSLGIDSKIINQKIIQPIEQKLGTLYENQKKLIKDYKPGDKIPKDVQKKLEKINIKISELADRTNGVLQGVLVDEKTLKPITYGVDYSKVLGFGLVDKPVSELTQADRDIIKLNVEEQIKTAKKINPRNTGMMLSANPFFDPKLMSRVIGDIASSLGSPTALVGLNVGLGVDPKSSLDRAILGGEAALAPAGIKALTSRLANIKNPAVRKGIETAAGLRLPGVFTPANVMRAARFASPVGIATLAGEGLYQLGKLGYDEQQRINAMSPEEKAQYLAEQQELMDVSA